MGADFPQVPIRELIAQGVVKLQTGPFGSQLHKHEYVDAGAGVPVIPTEGIGRGRIRADVDLPHVSVEKAGELHRHRLQEGDILFARRGIQATGLSACVDVGHVGSLCGTGAILLRVDRTSIHPRFLAAFLATDAAFNWLRSHAVGAVMPNLNTEIISNLVIPFPSMQTQIDIGNFVAALDDRIDLFRQTNTTLEAIAQALFKSWFVDFDPVHAKAEGHEPEAMDTATAALFPSEFEESELGLIPKGWSAGTLKNICKVHDSKRVPLSGLEREKRRGAYPYYGAASVMDYIDDYIFDGVYVLLAEDGSVATKDGFALTQYVWGRFWVNNHAHILDGVGGFSVEQLLLLLQRVHIHEYITGAVQAKLSQRNMFTIPAVIPPETISKAFNAYVSPLFAKIREGVEALDTLIKLRDTLLPRLISGKLRLPDAEREIEAVV